MIEYLDEFNPLSLVNRSNIIQFTWELNIFSLVNGVQSSLIDINHGFLISKWSWPEKNEIVWNECVTQYPGNWRGYGG